MTVWTCPSSTDRKKAKAAWRAEGLPKDKTEKREEKEDFFIFPRVEEKKLKEFWRNAHRDGIEIKIDSEESWKHAHREEMEKIRRERENERVRENPLTEQKTKRQRKKC